MNRERLKTLRDHLAGLPDDLLDMDYVTDKRDCGTVHCIGGWAATLAHPRKKYVSLSQGQEWLGIDYQQSEALFYPNEAFGLKLDELTRSDAIAAIDSMLANPDDDALPVWPEKAVAS